MATGSSVKLGIKAVTYYNSGSQASPTWAPMPSILDASIKASWDKPDASSRASLVKLVAKTMLTLSLELKVRADDVAADYQALLAAFVASTSILDVVVLNGPIAEDGAQGYRIYCAVTEGPEDQGAGAVIYDTFTLEPCFNVDSSDAAVFAQTAVTDGSDLAFADIG